MDLEPETARCVVHPSEAAVLACARCGRFSCEACRAADGVHCVDCAQLGRAASDRPGLWGVAGALLPLVTFSAASALAGALRPDLAGPMWRHVFGWMLGVLALLLSGLAGALTRIMFVSRRIGVRVALGLALQTLAVLGALFAALFAPVALAFMFGGVATQ